MVVYYLFESYMDSLNHPPFKVDQERLQDFPFGPLWMFPIKLQMEPQFKSINLLPMCAIILLEMVVCKLQEVM